MKIVDIASEIHSETNYSTSITLASISYWIRGQVGHINNLLFEDFYIEEVSGQFEIWDQSQTEISIEAVAIIKSLYRVFDYGLSVRSTMNALANDSILEFTDNLQGSTIRRTNKNEISRSFISLKAAEQDNLDTLVGAYRMRNTEPSQVAGDDTSEGRYNPDYPYTYRDWNNG